MLVLLAQYGVQEIIGIVFRHDRSTAQSKHANDIPMPRQLSC